MKKMFYPITQGAVAPSAPQARTALHLYPAVDANRHANEKLDASDRKRELLLKPASCPSSVAL